LLSVIIPVGPDETGLSQALLADLQYLPADSEILFGCTTAQKPFSEVESVLKALQGYKVQFLYAATGRAQQMNSGAAAASGEYLWFLHLDSRFDPSLITQLMRNIETYPQALHYCWLKFMADGPRLMFLNGWGANLRSMLFGTPFGDQGFVLSRQLFERLGGYSETVSCGEDHLLVWQARQQGVKLKCCYRPLLTSARKYRSQGWLSLTCRYQRLWLQQAWPQFKQLVRQRYF